jgi:hypothetical protein
VRVSKKVSTSRWSVDGKATKDEKLFPLLALPWTLFFNLKGDDDDGKLIQEARGEIVSHPQEHLRLHI